MYKHIVMGNNIKQSIRLALVVSFIFSLLYIVYTPVYAEALPQQNLRISPIIQNISLGKGNVVSFPVTIENLADKPLGIHIDTFSFNPDNPEFANPTNQHTLTSCTSLSDTDVIIPENSKKIITVFINVPKNVQDGGYYETLAYTPFISNQEQVHAPILLSKFLGFVFASVGNTSLKDATKKISVIDFKPKAYIVDKGNETISFTIQNNYKTHVIAKPFLSMTPLFEKPTSFLLEEKYLFPGFSRTWEKTVSLPVHIFYKATLTLSVGQGNIIQANTWFILLPYKFVIACIAAAGLLLLTLLRKRVFKALRILVRG